MRKKELLIWVVSGILVFVFAIVITALIDRYNSKPEALVLNPDKRTEKQASAQAAVTAEAMTYYSKNASANLEAALKELDDMKPIRPGKTK